MKSLFWKTLLYWEKDEGGGGGHTPCPRVIFLNKLLFDFKDIPKSIKKRSMNIWFEK